jgi:hypothetical protein
MSIRNFLHNRLSGDDADNDGDAKGTPPEGGQLPIPGYDRINSKHLIAELSKHSQAELTAIETYEKANKKRQPVFDKLRYLRGAEPLQGYDDLSVPEVLAGLEGAKTEKLQKTRLYERKFQRRPDLLEKIATALRERNPSVHRDPPRMTNQPS